MTDCRGALRNDRKLTTAADSRHPTQQLAVSVVPSNDWSSIVYFFCEVWHDVCCDRGKVATWPCQDAELDKTKRDVSVIQFLDNPAPLSRDHTVGRTT